MKTKIVSVSILIACILAVAFVRFPDQAKLIVYASGSPDVYGNKIKEFRIQQDTYGNATYYTIATLTNDTYGVGVEVPLTELAPVRFFIEVYFNSTLAASIADAKTKIKLNMTITGGGWSNHTLTGDDGPLNYLGTDGAFWLFDSNVYNVWVGSYPEEGTTYQAYIYYQVYA
jgi:hypothetical protein